MKNKMLAKSHKKLAKSQKKLKKAVRKLGQTGKQVKNTENPTWMTALAAVAGAVTTALADRDKRSQLANIASDAKEKATGLLTSPKDERNEAEETPKH